MSQHLSAADLRHILRIGFQESIVSRPEILSTVISNMGQSFTRANVSEQRLRNAATAVELPDELLERLLAELH